MSKVQSSSTTEKTDAPPAQSRLRGRGPARAGTASTTPPSSSLAVDRWREDDLVDVAAPEGATAWEESAEGLLWAGWIFEDPDEVETDPERVIILRTEDDNIEGPVLRNVPRYLARVMDTDRVAKQNRTALYELGQHRMKVDVWAPSDAVAWCENVIDDQDGGWQNDLRVARRAEERGARVYWTEEHPERRARVVRDLPPAVARDLALATEMQSLREEIADLRRVEKTLDITRHMLLNDTPTPPAQGEVDAWTNRDRLRDVRNARRRVLEADGALAREQFRLEKEIREAADDGDEQEGESGGRERIE